MRNSILGGFIGVLLAVGVLAACGGAGGGSTAATVDELELRIIELETLLQNVSRDTGGGLVVTDANLRVEGGNLIVRNGLSDTSTVNGAGNVIIGYNEFRLTGNDRSGSHMLVVGEGLNYTSYGGIVAGHVNDSTAPFAGVTGGYRNRAEGDYATVTGGTLNVATGEYASVTGGTENRAEGEAASVSGGLENRADGDDASISGGQGNRAQGGASSVLGGYRNEIWTAGPYACVSGGQENHAHAFAASVGGGRDNVITGRCGSIQGGRNNTIRDDPAIGGQGCAAVSGGYNRLVENEYSWAAGLLYQDD